MKNLIQLLGIAMAVFVFNACQQTPSTANVKLSTLEDSIIYGLGAYNVDILMEQFKVENPNLAIAYKGMKDQLEKKALFTPEEFNMIAQTFLTKQMEQAASGNEDKGKKFLEENASKDGVMTTGSGLQYKILEEGSGSSPKLENEVTVHYEGKLIDGTVFDSSIQRGEPVSFPVGGVISGWTEALQMMKKGAKWQLFIPSNLAYGPRGAGNLIGPNETLIFDVELIDFSEAANSPQ